MNQSGFIWERVRGIGKYNNEIAVRHEIYTYIYIYADNKEKIIGEKDPEFTYTIKMHNDNPNDVTNLYDIFKCPFIIYEKDFGHNVPAESMRDFCGVYNSSLLYLMFEENYCKQKSFIIL